MSCHQKKYGALTGKIRKNTVPQLKASLGKQQDLFQKAVKTSDETVRVDDVAPELQMELLELQANTVLKQKFEDVGVPKFYKFLDEANFPSLRQQAPGTGWLQQFKDRHDITCKNIVGEAASVDDPSLQKWMEKNLDRILATYADKDTYNADETGLFFQLLPAKTLAAKTDKCVGGKNSKNRITVLVCSNMDGSDKRDLLIIGKAKKPRGFAKVLSMPVAYRDNKKAWMTRDIFTKWLTDFDKAMDKKKRKLLLLLDNCSAHHVNAHLSAVEVLFLPPNTTAKLQPMDQGVIANFKVLYQRRVIERLLIDIRTAVDPASLKVPLEKAIFFASGAWRDIKPQTILHCFQKGDFSRSSGADESPAGNEVVAADGDAAATCLGRLWETASKVDLVPPGVDHMDFAFADDNIVATEDVSTEDLAKSVVDESADDTASDDDSIKLAPLMPQVELVFWQASKKEEEMQK
ncbi:tigger transposable element-derived protein 6-like [Ixodes scapularis]